MIYFDQKVVYTYLQNNTQSPWGVSTRSTFAVCVCACIVVVESAFFGMNKVGRTHTSAPGVGVISLGLAPGFVSSVFCGAPPGWSASFGRYRQQVSLSVQQ